MQKNDRDAGDMIGDFVSQFPSVQEASTPLKIAKILYNTGTGDKFTQKDYKTILNALPLPNLLPFTAYINHLSQTSNLPKK